MWPIYIRWQTINDKMQTALWNKKGKSPMKITEVGFWGKQFFKCKKVVEILVFPLTLIYSKFYFGHFKRLQKKAEKQLNEQSHSKT